MLDVAVHKNVLIHILKDIYTNIFIGPLLGFKGGTAVYLFYGLDRFSVDLDFDLLDALKGHLVFEQLKKILEEHGIIKELREKRYTLFFRIFYTNKFQQGSIKVEVNRRNWVRIKVLAG
jgi:predicted nucleotidyltransferase component of viral defense system